MGFKNRARHVFNKNIKSAFSVILQLILFENSAISSDVDKYDGSGRLCFIDKNRIDQ